MHIKNCNKKIQATGTLYSWDGCKKKRKKSLDKKAFK